jgi:hypothetical protein
VVSSDICVDDQEKHDYARLISIMNTTRFTLVQVLSKSNNTMFNFTVLCCRKMVIPDELQAANYIVYRTVL